MHKNDSAGFTDHPGRIRGPVIAGVIPGQPIVVARRAAELAVSLGVELVCAYVDVSSYTANESDVSPELRPIDPDGVYDDVDEIAVDIKENLAHILAPYDIDWSFRAVAGDPAHALGTLGDSLGAAMIVVGTRERGFTHRLEEMLNGSVAVHLAHRQHRPVLVVPLNPQPFDGIA